MASSMNTAMRRDPDCFPPPMRAVSNGLLQGDIPIDFALPLLIVQIAVVLLVTRSLACVFRRIRQPRVLAEIIGGVLLGPTALGRNEAFRNAVFPPASLPLLETVATMGLMFFIFIVGLELDLTALRRSGKSALLIATVGIAAPFAASAALAPLILHSSASASGTASAPPPRLGPLLVFMGTPLSISAFSVLVRVMSELGMLSTDIAKLAVPAAAVNDVSVWTLLAIGVAIAGDNRDPLVPLWVLLCGAALGAAILAVARGVMAVVARRAVRSGGDSTDLYVCITLTAVLLAGLGSDAIGVHPLLGPFLLGMFMPKDNSFPTMIVEKTEDFVTGLMLPLFFASSGLKTNLSSITGVASLGFLALFFAAAAVGKIGGTFAAARLCGLPTRRALILGFLMNTKGLAVLIVLNVGKDLHALTDEIFAILVLTCLLTSFLTFPIVSALWGAKGDASSGNIVGGDAEQSNCAAHSFPSSVEAVEKTQRQLRLMVAMGSGCDSDYYAGEDHHYATTAAVVDVLEAARGRSSSKKEAVAAPPVKLYTLWVEQMSDRRSAILKLLQSSVWTYFGGGTTLNNVQCWKRRPSRTPQPSMGAAFVPSFQPSDALSKVVVRSMTSVVSELDQVHRDIAFAAAKKRATLVILPWLKPVGEGERPQQQRLPSTYLRLLDDQQPPCSVAILVAMGAESGVVRSSCFLPYKVALLFCGGADDREALSLARRMAEHPGVRLRVIRFVKANAITNGSTKRALPVGEDDDDHCAISKLKEEAAAATAMDRSNCFSAPPLYEEEAVEEAAAAVKLMAGALVCEADLVVVGRRSASDSASDGGEGFTSKSDLGVLGEVLVSVGGGAGRRASILVVEQKVAAGGAPDKR